VAEVDGFTWLRCDDSGPKVHHDGIYYKCENKATGRYGIEMHQRPAEMSILQQQWLTLHSSAPVAEASKYATAAFD
jgi:hypothetical protein